VVGVAVLAALAVIFTAVAVTGFDHRDLNG
jgi:hypothetical protein